MATTIILNLLQAAILTLSSQSTENNIHPDIKQIEWEVTDSVKIHEKDYKLIKEDQYVIDIKVVNRKKLKTLQQATHPIIQLTLNGKEYLVKENYLLNASFPENCDAFYSSDQSGKIVWLKSRAISFRKVARQ